MAATTNAEILRQYKIRFSLIIELVLPLDSNPNTTAEVKNLSSNFK